MRLKITMRQSAPKADKAGTSTTRSNKRKCQDIENPHEKPSRPTKSRCIVKLHKKNEGPSKLENLPSELQHMIYVNVFQSIKNKDQTSNAVAPAGSSKDTSSLSNVTSILRASKKTNVEAVQAFHDTVTRPVSRPII